MTTVITADKSKARIWFIGLYLFSIGIAFLIYTTMAKTTPIEPVIKKVEVAVAAKKNTEELARLSAYLHNRLQNVQNAYLATATPGNAGAAAAAENSFAASLDSLEKATANGDASERTAIKTMTADFRASFKKMQALAKVFAAPGNSVATTTTGDNDPAIQSLKNKIGEEEQKFYDLQTESQGQLSEKDKTIATLESRLKDYEARNNKNATAASAQIQAGLAERDKRIATLQNALQSVTAEKDKTIAALQNQLKVNVFKGSTVAVKNDAGSNEWRQKHAQLKSAYDILLSKTNSLLSSYKNLAEDNKRLTSQLQIRRASGRG